MTNYIDQYRGIYSFYQGDRKPSDFADVTAIIDFNTLPTADKAAFRALDIVNAGDEGIMDPFSNIAEIWADTQYFILQYGFFGSEFYFIDTQGYNYCRYVARIVNFSPDNQ